MLICNSSKAFTSQNHRLKGISDPDAVPSVKAIDRRPRPASYTSQHWWLFVGSSILTRSSQLDFTFNGDSAREARTSSSKISAASFVIFKWLRILLLPY
jgi:hypothetical protein